MKLNLGKSCKIYIFVLISEAFVFKEEKEKKNNNNQKTRNQSESFSLESEHVSRSRETTTLIYGNLKDTPIVINLSKYTPLGQIPFYKNPNQPKSNPQKFSPFRFEFSNLHYQWQKKFQQQQQQQHRSLLTSIPKP